jgi:hypothetical protein
MPVHSSNDRSSLWFLLFRRRSPLPHAPQPRPPAPLHLSRPQGSPGPRRPPGRPRHLHVLLRRVSLRLRSQFRSRPSLFRRRPGSHQAQNRHRPRLPQPDPGPIHPHRSARVRQRLRHRRVAPRHPLLLPSTSRSRPNRIPRPPTQRQARPSPTPLPLNRRQNRSRCFIRTRTAIANGRELPSELLRSGILQLCRPRI